MDDSGVQNGHSHPIPAQIFARQNQTTLETERCFRRQILFVMGGFDNISTVETMDPVLGLWVSHDIPDAPSEWTWICSMGLKILVLEGTNRSFRSFNILTRSWIQLRSPPHYIFGSSRASSHLHVYIIGGVDPHGCRCDRYDISTDQWEEAPPLREGRQWPASACIPGKLYCSGGFSWSQERVSYSLEVLDLRENRQWFSLPPMSIKRGCHTLVSCGRFLWAIGGWYEGEYLAAVEKFNVHLCQWSSVRALPVPTSHFSASVREGRIYVIGGKVEGSEPVSTVYVYDEQNNEWMSALSLRLKRWFHGSCMVWMTSDADNYSVTSQLPSF